MTSPNKKLERPMSATNQRRGGPGGGPGRRGGVPGGKMDKQKAGTLKRVLGYMMHYYKWHYILVLCCIAVTVYCQLQSTLFTQTLIDDYITPLLGTADPSYAALGARLLKLAVVLLIGVIASYLYQRLMVTVGQGTMSKMREDLFTHMETLPIKYFDTHSHGDIMSVYTNDIDTQRQLISQTIPQLFNSAITIVSTFISMVVLSVPLTCLSLAMIGVTLFVSKGLAGKSRGYFLAQQRDLGILNGYIEEMVSGQKVVKVFCYEDRAVDEFKELNNNLRTSGMNANIFANIMMPVNGNIGNISYVLCAMLGALIAVKMDWGLTLGTLVTFLTLNRNFSRPISQISMQMNTIVMAMAGADRVFSLMDEQSEEDDGYVELCNVYENEDGSLRETKDRTGIWAWRHPHKADGTVTYQRLEGELLCMMLTSDMFRKKSFCMM